RAPTLPSWTEPRPVTASSSPPCVTAGHGAVTVLCGLEGIENCSELGDLCLGEPSEEQRADFFGVAGCGLAQGRLAFLGEDRPQSAPVVVAMRAVDVSVLFEPGDLVGQTALGDDHAVGQPAHAHALLRCFGQVDEDSVLDEGEPRLCAQVVLELVVDP